MSRGKIQVPLGQSNTGSAVVLPDAGPDPISVLGQMAQRKRVDDSQILRAGTQAKVQKTASKAFEIPDGLLREDIPFIQKRYNELMDNEAAYAADYAASHGGNEAGFDQPGSPYYRDIQKARQDLLLLADRSVGDQEYRQKIDVILSDPAKVAEYDEGAIDDYYGWLGSDLETRATLPRPAFAARFDVPAYLIKMADNFITKSGKSWSRFVKEGVEQGSITEVGKAQVKEQAITNLDVEPRYANQIQGRIANMSDDEKSDKAFEAGEMGLTLPQFVAYEDIKGKIMSRATSTKSRSGGFGFGQEVDMAGAETLLNFSSGIVTGSYEGYQPLESSGLFSDASQGFLGIEEGRYMVAQNIPNYQIGEDETGTLSINLEGAVFDKKTGAVGVYTGGPLTEVNWMRPEEFFMNITQPITDYSKEFKLPYLTKLIEEEGLKTQRGGVRLQDYNKNTRAGSGRRFRGGSTGTSGNRGAL